MCRSTRQRNTPPEQTSKQTNKQSKLIDEDMQCSEAKGKAQCAESENVCLCISWVMSTRAFMCFSLNWILVLKAALSALVVRRSVAWLVMQIVGWNTQYLLALWKASEAAELSICEFQYLQHSHLLFDNQKSKNSCRCFEAIKCLSNIIETVPTGLLLLSSAVYQRQTSAAVEMLRKQFSRP